MKKTLAIYTATAILMGFTAMMLPLALETGPPSYTPQPAFTRQTQDYEALTKYTGASPLYGIASKPANLLPAGLMFLVALAAAVGVYATLKRKSQ